LSIATRYFKEDGDDDDDVRDHRIGSSDADVARGGQNALCPIGATDDRTPWDTTPRERDDGPRRLEKKADAGLMFVAAMAEKIMQAYHQLEGS
jgi:hypothetical protein